MSSGSDGGRLIGDRFMLLLLLVYVHGCQCHEGVLVSGGEHK